MTALRVLLAILAVAAGCWVWIIGSSLDEWVEHGARRQSDR